MALQKSFEADPAECDSLLYERAPPDWLKAFCDDDEEDETIAPASDGGPDVGSAISDDEWHSGGLTSPTGTVLSSGSISPIGAATISPIAIAHIATAASITSDSVTDATTDFERGSMEQYELPGMGADPVEVFVPVDQEEGKRRGGELLSMLSGFGVGSLGSSSFSIGGLAEVPVPPSPPGTKTKANKISANKISASKMNEPPPPLRPPNTMHAAQHALTPPEGQQMFAQRSNTFTPRVVPPRVPASRAN